MVERMQPLLGTFVSIRVDGLPEAESHSAIDRGFAAIARIHRLMSFHEPASDLSRLNREAWRRPVTVDGDTLAVLDHALAIARASAGVFDVAVAGDLVTQGLLPRPVEAPQPDPGGSWRDIALVGNRVTFARPLWIDFGGIAKGYAVDRAMDAMALGGEVQAVVNAGGDLKVSGPSGENVRLGLTMEDAVPVISIENGSLASSTGAARWGAVGGAHRDGARRRSTGTRSFASVAARSCMTADALTKVVLARGRKASGLLRMFDATGYYYSAPGGWRILGQ